MRGPTSNICAALRCVSCISCSDWDGFSVVMTSTLYTAYCPEHEHYSLMALAGSKGRYTNISSESKMLPPLPRCNANPVTTSHTTVYAFHAVLYRDFGRRPATTVTGVRHLWPVNAWRLPVDGAPRPRLAMNSVTASVLFDTPSETCRCRHRHS